MGKYVVDCAILPVMEIVFLCCCFCYLKLPIATYYNFRLDSVYYYKYSVNYYSCQVIFHLKGLKCYLSHSRMCMLSLVCSV